MNPITRLYRHFFPVPELSCFVKGLIKALEEQKPKGDREAYVGWVWTLTFEGKQVPIITEAFYSEDCYTEVDGHRINLAPHEQQAVMKCVKTLRQAERDRLAALRAPIIASIEKLGCPTESP